ncbi:MAG: cupredoxin domain-containing protein [Armatimonadota bacterium]|nr:cupredoxin domain-containing protein [Armatimonadota bacterium]MDR7439866.1 cupredoxin domain-containing protein [Armatimonadota bacterium]MDR7563339.1 cupredoxin domain-containing protein [Armatimonadota bacterium]MDR7568386.1 cupredoxin domain-containing protein [Armatimonadota bacterium]MDR7601958.1 cupredoxin domain-containing protein [Armatimonadota bacterium]
MRAVAMLGAVGLILALGLGGLAGTAPVSVKVIAKEFAFEPKEIKVKAGQPVKLILENKGVIEHDIVIEKLNAKTESLKPGKSAEVTFTPKTRGRYLIYCSVPGHKEAGMTGTLVVQ